LSDLPTDWPFFISLFSATSRVTGSKSSVSRV